MDQPRREAERRLDEALRRAREEREAQRRRLSELVDRARRLRAAELKLRGEIPTRVRRGRPRKPGPDLDPGGLPVEPNRPSGLTGGAAAALELDGEA